MFGTPTASSSTPAFGTPSSTPAFGTPFSTPAFGTPSSTSIFGTPPSSTPAFGTPTTAQAFGTPSTTTAFGTPSTTPAFGTPSTPALSPFFSPQAQPSPFSINSQFSPQQQQQQQWQPLGYAASPSPFGNTQITTQMAPVAPLQLPLAERDLHAIIDAYKIEPGNPKYAFRHLLLSVTDPAARVKPVCASDIMWAEAMTKLEGMDSVDRDRLWPQLVQGFKDLSDRLKLQDEVLVSDAERLKMTQANVKMLQGHFQAGTLQRIQSLKQKELVLTRRLLRVTRIVEALECRGFRIPLMKEEAELAVKLDSIARQLKGPGAELSRRVQNLLSATRLQANSGVLGGSVYFPGSTKIQEQSLAELQEVLQQETEAIARLGNVLKRDARDMEIIMPAGIDMLEDGRQRS